MTMITMMQTDDWLREHCRVTDCGLVWPRGTFHTWSTSRKIAHTYLSLGLEPSEAVSIDLVQSLLQRIEGLEQMFTTLGPLDTVRRSSVQCTVCRHAPHGADMCHEAVPTDQGRVCRCDGKRRTGARSAVGISGVKFGEVIREGDPRMNLVQDLIEGDARRHDWAACLLDTLKDIPPEDRQAYIDAHPYRAPEEGD